VTKSPPQWAEARFLEGRCAAFSALNGGLHLLRLENKSRLRSGLGGLAAGSLLLFAQGGMAGTITVNSAMDGPLDSNIDGCTLREALASANMDAPVGGCDIEVAGPTTPDDTIDFDGVTQILLNAGELTIDDQLNGTTLIDGGPGVTIDANQDVIFGINSETTLDTLTLTGANLDGGNGGAIFASAALTIIDSNINDNVVSGIDDDSGLPARGAGIFTSANLTLMNTSMSGNFAPRAGGAIEISGTGAPISVSITGGTFDGNGTGVDEMGNLTTGMNAPGNGGVLHVSDNGSVVTVDIEGGTYTNNVAASEGGALWNGGGTMTVDGSTITGNTAMGAAADNGGGGIFNNGGTLNINSEAGATLISENTATGAAGSGGGIFNDGGSLFIDDLGGDSTTAGVTISSNLAPRAGGGIESRNSIGNTLRGVILTGNTAGDVPVEGGDPISANPGNGGGVHISGTGRLDVLSTSAGDRRSTVSNNLAANEGGGLWFNVSGGSVEASDVSDNEAAGNGAANGGGGIFHNAGNTPNDGDDTGGTVRVEGSTVTGNDATGTAGSGGGIFVNAGGTVNVEASIIAGNTANRAGGGVETLSTVEGAAMLSLTGVSLTGNTAGAGDAANPGNGGGVHVTGTGATTNVSASLVADNVAASEGGGLWNFRGSVMNVNATSLLRNMANGDDADNGGGALFQQDTGDATTGTINVSYSRIIGNSATGDLGSGGGVLVDAGGTLNVDNSTIASNTSNRAGGGVENNAGTVALTRVNLGGTDSAAGNMAGTNPGKGGGLHITGTGSAVIMDSLVGYNTGTEGGGLWADGNGTLTVGNSTISNNQAIATADVDGDGGGVYQVGGGDSGSTIDFSTIAENAAEGDGGGVGAGNATMSVITVTNSIVAGNTSAGDAATNNVDVEAGVTADAGSNLIAADAGFNGAVRLFGPRAVQGEAPLGLPTAVYPLADTSTAIDASADCGPDADQRTVMRPAADCDYGSFEAADIPALTVTNTSADAVTVTENSENVVVAGMTLQNNSMESIDVGGFAGSINVNNLPANIDPSALLEFDFLVYGDDNSNGMLDDGEMPLDANVSGLDLSTLRFQVAFPPETLEAGASQSVIVVATNMPQVAWNPGMIDVVGTHPHKPGPALSWQTPAIAGGALLGLLSLVSVGRIRRRTRVFLLATSAALVLTACGGGGGGGSGGGVIPDGSEDPMNPLVRGDL
jgi:CSLREA domain-containing protein